MAETVHLDVLLVEDNPGDARLVEHHLNSPAVAHFVDDVTISHVESLAPVAEREEAAYDVVLLDLGLPESTGLATLDRATEIVEGVPIIVLTGMQDREMAIEAINRGAQDYLPKEDLDGDRLVRALRYAVVRSRQQRAIQRQTDQMDFFNSILQHDILNGMNVIRARGELLEDTLDSEEREYASTIVQWSDDLIELTEKVRSVLETVTEEGGRDHGHRELQAVLDDAADRARSVSDDCTVTIEPQAVTVVADELLDDVFGNLFLNAVEHGGDDVTIDVTTTVEEGVVTVRLADDGDGIPSSDARRIFERGEKGSESGGTGFGLYFVDTMVRSYGGDVWVEDSDSGGAAFYVELPHATL
ncbi:hybrid sensor histidine kinase/response regulator [Haloarcula amylolytica]|uniref:histidine kinase n=1 Tax=Haloarcula amylolytica JCM 13557 TaxID=1227452 RepID=M0KSJ8_9EURY|nr:ATP-binding protein [Haloarcula amylolytica]EMA23179.1 signal-transducing histidine kinase [Haloarcula amylolytica JCM 13557]